jgi:hypothetical protein
MPAPTALPDVTYVPGPGGDFSTGQWVKSDQVPTRPSQQPTIWDVLDEQTAGGRQLMSSGAQDIAANPTALNPLSPQGLMAQGKIALGGLDAAVGGVATAGGAGLDMLSRMTGIGADRSNISRNAGDVRMGLDVAMPELAGGGPLAASRLTARQGMDVAGSLADQRIAQRGPAFAGQANQLNAGVDPTKAAGNLFDRMTSLFGDLARPGQNQSSAMYDDIQRNLQGAPNAMQQPLQRLQDPQGLQGSLMPMQPVQGYREAIEEYRNLDPQALEASRAGGFPLMPALRVPGTAGAPIPGVVKTINQKNADTMYNALDMGAQAHPDPALSEQAWSSYMADMVAKEPGEYGVPIPPANLIRYRQNPQELVQVMNHMTPDQIKMASDGLDAAEEIGRMYANGMARPQDTAKLLLWGILSRQKSAYPHEAAFLDAINHVDAQGRTLDDFIELAARGEYDDAAAKNYKKWAETALPPGSPGRASTENLNAFGATTLKKLNAEADGLTGLNRLHRSISDPNMSGQQIRREYHKYVAGSGIDNKVLSFILLLTGRKDVMVFDRIQFNHLFNDGRFGDYNLYTPVMRKGEDGKDVAITGSTISDLGKNGTGLVMYEAVERELQKILPDVYQALGRPYRGVGQFHWESWVLTSQQEVSHPSVSVFADRMAGRPNAGLADISAGRGVSYEGRFDAGAYGARYGRTPQGGVIYYPDSAGNMFEFDPQTFQEFQSALMKPSSGVGYTGFKVSDFSEGTTPWVKDDRINKQALDAIIAQWGRPVAGNQPPSVSGALLADGSGKIGNDSIRDKSVFANWRQEGTRLAGQEATGAAPRSYRRGSGVDRSGVLTPDQQTRDTFTKAGISSPPLSILKPGLESGAKYNKDMIAGLKGNPWKAQVEIKSAEDLQDAQLFQTADGAGGFAIKPDGDIVAVYSKVSSPHKRLGISMLQAAIEQGGRKLDAFDTFLPGIYSETGFRPVARIPWNDAFAPKGWDKKQYAEFKSTFTGNPGEPDIVFFVYDPSYFGDGTGGAKVADYAEAAALQQAEMDALASTVDALYPKPNSGITDQPGLLNVAPQSQAAPTSLLAP